VSQANCDASINAILPAAERGRYAAAILKFLHCHCYYFQLHACLLFDS